MHKILLAIGFILICTSFKSNQSAVKYRIQTTYDKLIKQTDFRMLDGSELSSSLYTLIQQCIAKEQQSIEQLKAAHSTDKPMIIEGDLFTSNYEGATSYTIRTMKIEGKMATADIYFKYSTLDTVLHWSDRIQLVNENKQWKIDNVFYLRDPQNMKDLKSFLKDFLKEEGQLVGKDIDPHGCIGSAGYTWSSIKKECIRIWELPFQLVNAEKTYRAGVCFSSDLKKAEVFTPNGPILMQQLKKEVYTYKHDTLKKMKGKWQLYTSNQLIYKAD